MVRYEVLTGLPPIGPMAVPIDAGGSSGGWTGHREGFVVRFHTSDIEGWVGNFQPGSGGCDGAWLHPNGKHIIVLAHGQGYVVDPESREIVLRFPGSIQHVIDLPQFGTILFSDGIRFEAIKDDGIWWTSARISWDEIRNIHVNGNTLHGEASAPDGANNIWVPFSLDIRTGEFKGGTYQSQARRAVQIGRNRAD